MPGRASLRGLIALVLAGATFAGCRRSDDAVLLVVVTVTGSPPPDVVALDVTLTAASQPSSQRYSRQDGATISFPTTLSAHVAARVGGDLSIDVDAKDVNGTTVATGHAGPVSIRAGQTDTAYVNLACNPGAIACTGDGGAPLDGGDGSVSAPTPRCGNGRVDTGETCDVAIAAGAPGACPPPDCDDGIACTTDAHTGDGCTAQCTHAEIFRAVAGDGCCPRGLTRAEDPDCSATCGDGTVEPGESCDTAIAAGAPGACPSDASCATGAPCVQDHLISAGTCSAVCVHQLTTQQSDRRSDGCCPVGATNAGDVDCPVVCGNGLKEPGEACDIGIAATIPGNCPTTCDDHDACTIDFTAGSGCQTACVHIPITSAISGDGCCPRGASHATDTDCAPVCGNGVAEPGEACDNAASGSAACPTSCPAPPAACLTTTLTGSATDCSLRCTTAEIKTCSARSDGCCPAGCTYGNDVDCSPACGDGSVQPALGEICDLAIPAGQAGACPTTCISRTGCTEARLVSAGTCQAHCVLLAITAPRAGDGCCPPGADFTVDADCAPRCGNGVVETPTETCDYAAPGSCPGTCASAGACTRFELRGNPASCSTACIAHAIASCASGDGCCPTGCTAANDSDCAAICGDGVVEDGEACDRGISAGATGACARSCDDGDACTADLAAGSVEGCTRTCLHPAITACLGGDGCCPPGCSAATDRDCDATCGDGRVGAGETCDPPSTCPTSCPDDGDACTTDRLTGDPGQCNVACRHMPITSCSGTTADFCCPSGCTRATDTDC